MIGRLKGILVHKQPPWLVVDVNGVGYELEAPMSTFYDLPDIGREVALFTHYAQKEDSVSLYGFLREGERRLFRDVQKVSGIGAKIALAVLSGTSVDEFARLVQTSDVTALTRIPGIGKKTAERMVVELRDRAADFGGGGGPIGGGVPADPHVRSRRRPAATGLQAGRSRPHGARCRGRGRRRRHHHPQGAKVRAPLSPGSMADTLPASDHAHASHGHGRAGLLGWPWARSAWCSATSAPARCTR
jgi:Holliday junction DNA helicase RuvA